MINETESINHLGESATEWRQLYFAGISKESANDLNLTSGQIEGLLSMINVRSTIATGAAVDPTFLINDKGTTPWLALFALVYHQKKEDLSLIANGKSRIIIPNEFINQAFGNHVNWPEEVLNKYELNLAGKHLFILPFLVHKDTDGINNLAQSMKSPDGSLEVFGVYEFKDDQPELFLKEFADLIDFIKENRPDVIE